MFVCTRICGESNIIVTNFKKEMYISILVIGNNNINIIIIYYYILRLLIYSHSIAHIIYLHSEYLYKEYNNCVQINLPLAARASIISLKTPKAQIQTVL